MPALRISQQHDKPECMNEIVYTQLSELYLYACLLQDRQLLMKLGTARELAQCYYLDPRTFSNKIKQSSHELCVKKI